MNQAQKQLLSKRIETGLLVMWGVVLLLLPLVFSTLTTDAFQLPKQVLIATAVLLSLLGMGARMLLDKQVRIRRTPFDVPVVLFTVAAVISAVFSLNRANSFIAVSLLIFGALTYFMLVNTSRKGNTLVFLTTSLLTGTVLGSIVTILARFKVFVIPFAATQNVTFTPFGAGLDQVLYTATLLPLAAVLTLPLLKKKIQGRAISFGVMGLVMLAGFGLALYSLFTTQKPLLLPFTTGFQTAFAAISQDTGRLIQGFFFGSGYGTYETVFARFKPIVFNAYQNMWYLSFSQSSSYALELLATTGIVGFLAFFFILVKIFMNFGEKVKNPVFLPLLVLSVTAFILPFNPLLVTLFFVLLALFALEQTAQYPHLYSDVELRFVAFKNGVLNFMSVSETTPRKDTNFTHIVGFAFVLAIAIFLGYFATTYVWANVLFQNAVVAAGKNNGTGAYKYETQALTTFPYQSGYYRVFSQTNIALANSLLALSGGKSSPSAQAQQTAYTLIQQSITSARTATTLSPLSAVEWQNLSSTYRALIGLGQNAEQFSIAAAQQAVQLDPTNPQEYLNLGGIYYQLGQYDNALRQFQIAANLKQDYANAYYNLGHAYEQKNDLQNALAAYQVVKQLTTNDKANYDRITSEISALQAKIGSNANAAANAKVPTSATTQQPLGLQQPTTQLPAQKQQVPLVSVTPTPQQ